MIDDANRTVLVLIVFVLISASKIIYAQMLGNCPPSGIHYFADQYDCSKFHLCANGLEKVMQCAPNTYFNLAGNRCDATGCNRCYAYPIDEITFLPSITDCTEYFVCLGHEQFHHICSNGMYYNHAAKSCDIPENVNCTLNDPIVQVTPTPPLSLDQHPEKFEFNCPKNMENNSIEFFPHPYDCLWYFVCTPNTNVVNMKSCLSGLMFDGQLRGCEIESKALCFATYKPTCQLNEITFEPHPYSCKYYFICIDGEPILKQCAPNLLYDKVTGTCVDEDLINCSISRV